MILTYNKSAYLCFGGGRMKFVQAQFSLKYEPQIKIRRAANDIEDFLQEYYGTPQTMPLPDEFALDAPRIILYSKNGHSQIRFSQISVDFIVNFDNEYSDDFKMTQEYIQKRIAIIIELLRKININEYLFCGITYSTRLDIGTQKPIEYIRRFLGEDIPQDDLYEVTQNLASVKDEKFFVNQQIGTYKEFQGKPGIEPNLFEVGNCVAISEGVSLTLDINNRYQYVYKNVKNSIDECLKDVDSIYSLLKDNINRWE